jgi:uncharacterized circularly permuted ATP-grasp superfamily protein
VKSQSREIKRKHRSGNDDVVALFDVDSYEPSGRAWDEMFEERGVTRPHYGAVHDALGVLTVDDFRERCIARDRSFRDQGITFSLSGEERPFPLDLLPRIIPAAEWEVIESGVTQRVTALEAFLDDLYGAARARVLVDGVVPRSLLLSSTHLRREVAGFRPANGVRIHVAGIDLVRDAQGRYRVLEDNLRTPSGISYVIENRRAMTHVFPELFATQRVRPVADYPAHLLEALRAGAPAGRADPTVVVLTPGVHNAAYFEHAFLARQMGIALVEGRDLVCRDGVVFMRSTSGRQRVDVVYRRIDDDFLDPLQFRPDSVLGCAGIVNAARSGNVTIANAVGNGVADDKALYGYVPDLIRYYLDEEPILTNVDTFDLRDPDQRAHVLDRLDELVVKPVDGSGGYGIVVGPSASDEQIEQMRRKVLENPRGWIAQEVVQLSTSPTHTGEGFAPRHVDLRPFAVNDGNRLWVAPGGLTRVALPEGSLVVNSSQGGGSKDTWVLTPSGDALERLVAAGARQPGAVWSRPPAEAPVDSAGAQPAQQQQSRSGPC